MVLGDTYVGFGGIEVSTSSLPPELEEAAILFANEQTAECIAALRAAIQQDMPPQWQRQGWLMLLDVLQASADRKEFENVAIDFATQFELSPPGWVEPVGGPFGAGASKPAAATVRISGELDESGGKQFETAQRTMESRGQVTIDFGRLSSVDAAGAAAACEYFRQAQSSSAEVKLLNVEKLATAAMAGIESGRRDADESMWQLALLAHRLLGLRQQFEEISLAYCVTYEISPPSWAPPTRNIRVDNKSAEGNDTRAKAASKRSGPVGDAFHFRGDVLGRMTAELTALRAFASDRSEILIDCRELRRIDFAAAGELLNEIVALSTQGRTVLFVEPSTIVEAMLIVMGIHEVADIRSRNR
ncbi:MAG: STAS domain-containing protein [Quisquiliibacterium sp.]